MMNKKLFAALLTIAAVVALVPGTAVAAPTGRDSSVIGRGTWTLGTAKVICSHQPQGGNPLAELLSTDQCGYEADSAPGDTQPEEGCTEISYGRRVAGCRAALKAATQRTTGLGSLCLQGGLFDLTAEYPAGPPDGHVTVYSGALNKSFAVPVSITVSGAVGHVYGTRLLDSGPVDRIVVDGRFLWNLRPEQNCPFQGDQPTPGVWQGTYTFWEKAV
jgi:hypothetical protein